jgi:hypothetical protein
VKFDGIEALPKRVQVHAGRRGGVKALIPAEECD